MSEAATIKDLGHGPLEVESLYNQVRDEEGRLLSDEVVMELPESGLQAAHGSEWKVRKRSAEILLKKLNGSGKSLKILDVGCGSGWLSAMMARSDHQVTAIDVHKSELEQAARCFPQLPVTWCYGDAMRLVVPQVKLDRVVFAASIQYFPDLLAVIKKCFDELLIRKGEVHIVDSPFYTSENEQQQAKARSVKYYKQMGVPELADFYHHHLHPSQLAGYDVRSERGRYASSLLPRRLPFEHVVIKR